MKAQYAYFFTSGESGKSAPFDEGSKGPWDMG